MTSTGTNAREWRFRKDRASPWPKSGGWRLLPLSAAFLTALILAASTLFGPWLLVRTELAPADVIVVLGGGSSARGAHAAQLHAMGLAPRILVSGAGDCLATRRVLIGGGVPPSSITLECLSRSTMENARRSAPLLSSAGVQSAILVTSWYHTTRALACFRAMLPGIRWMVTAADEYDATPGRILGQAHHTVLEEFVKIAWYTLYWGIFVATTAPDPARAQESPA